MPKILINGITLDCANLVPVLTDIKVWKKEGYKSAILGNKFLLKRINELGIVKDFDFIELKENTQLNSFLKLIIAGIKRNLMVIFQYKKLIKNYSFVYSRSSVLDLIIFPFFCKVLDKKIKWGTVFDNTVLISNFSNRPIGFFAWLFFRISLFLIKKADLIFVISPELKHFLIKNGFYNSKIIITGNAVENDLIEKAESIKNLKIDALFTGRINETKGIYDMIEVLKIVVQKYPKFILGILGDGDKITVKNLKQKITELKLEKNVNFLGYKTGIEKFNIIKSSKCFWFLSGCESFGIALLEAVCCGLPAFTYDLDSFKKIYKNNEIITSKKNDYLSVANKVLEVFKNKNFNNQKGEKLLGKYTWEKIAQKELMAIKSLI